MFPTAVFRPFVSVSAYSQQFHLSLLSVLSRVLSILYHSIIHFAFQFYPLFAFSLCGNIMCVCIYYCIAKFIFFRSFCFLPFREKASLSSVHISVLPTLNRFCIYRLTCMHWFESALASLHVRVSTAQCY